MARYSRKTVRTNTVIIGAGAAGLATAACLRRHRVPLVILEKDRSIGQSWIRRYDRLHLHTHRRFSSLPYLSFPRHSPAYPSRLQFVDYLERYAQCFNLEPLFGERVKSVMRIGDVWSTRAKSADYLSRHLVIATGYNRTPVLPSWPGQDSFPGQILHSYKYTNGSPFEDQHVLVVGLGNSGGEIALDLFEHNARVSLAVRGPVNIVPRDLFGLSSHAITVGLSWLPPQVIDSLSEPLVRMQMGDLSRYGLETPQKGPMAQIEDLNRVPLLDIGTIQLIKQGHIDVFKGIDRVDGDTVHFTDGEKKAFDAIILATGFKNNVGAFLRDRSQVTDKDGDVISSGTKTALPNLYFCGFKNASTGLIREIGIEAKRIARYIQHADKSIPAEPQKVTTDPNR